MGKKVATYNSEIKQLVPGYDLKSYSPGTITVTKSSVENEQYASWSEDENKQGMYIKQYSIGDGKTEYSDNQLVATVDLSYRYLSPINGENYEGGQLPYQLGNDGCIEIDNINKTIEKGASYEFTLTPKSGFSIVPSGYIEVKDGTGWSSTDISWQSTEGPVNITVPSNKITGNLRFVLSDCSYKLYIQKTVDGHNIGNLEEIGTFSCSDLINVDSLKPAQDPIGTHFINITEDGAVITGSHQFCGDTILNVNYATNQYTIDIRRVSICVNVALNPDVRTIEYGSQLTITLTPKAGKVNIGEVAIEMGERRVITYPAGETSIQYTILTVTDNIVISANCGEDDTHNVTVNWVDLLQGTVLNTETFVVNDGSQIAPEDYVNDYTLPEGYFMDSMNPMEGTTIVVDSDKTITYNCKKYEYRISFSAGDGIIMNPVPGAYVLYGESITIDNAYEIAQGYANASEIHTGNAGVSLDNGSVTLTNVKSNVSIIISASKLYHVTYTLDGGGIQLYKDGQIVPAQSSTDTVEDGNCSEMGYIVSSGYNFDGATSSVQSIVPTVDTTNRTVEVCPTSDVTITLTVSRIIHNVVYDIYEDGVKIDTQGTGVAEGETDTLSYRKTNTGDYLTPTVSSSDPDLTPTVNVRDGRGFDITAGPITRDVTISLYLVTRT